VRNRPAVIVSALRVFFLCVLVGLWASSLWACSSTGALPASDATITGQWGGAHASLTLTDSGGTITYDCAHGGLSAPVRPDGAGHFEVVGVHVPEHGGPVQIGEVPDTIPARYVGDVSADRMTLLVVAGANTLGPFALGRGTTPQLFRCL
jgi:hypothetical protein